jgi:hypothetical protein
MPQLANAFEREALEGDFMFNNKQARYAGGQVPKLKVV